MDAAAVYFVAHNTINGIANHAMSRFCSILKPACLTGSGGIAVPVTVAQE